MGRSAGRSFAARLDELERLEAQRARERLYRAQPAPAQSDTHEHECSYCRGHYRYEGSLFDPANLHCPFCGVRSSRVTGGLIAWVPPSYLCPACGDEHGGSAHSARGNERVPSEWSPAGACPACGYAPPPPPTAHKARWTKGVTQAQLDAAIRHDRERLDSWFRAFYGITLAQAEAEAEAAEEYDDEALS